MTFHYSSIPDIAQVLPQKVHEQPAACATVTEPGEKDAATVVGFQKLLEETFG